MGNDIILYIDIVPMLLKFYRDIVSYRELYDIDIISKIFLNYFFILVGL